MALAKKVGIGGLVMISLIAGGILATTPEVCESPEQNDIPFPIGTGNQKFNIIIPDNNCERINGIILSNLNYTFLQENVGAFTVPRDSRVATNEDPTHNYCEVARWIWEGQTDEYRKKLENLKQYMIIAQCVEELWQYNELPQWYKTVWNWYLDDKIPDQELISGMEYLRI